MLSCAGAALNVNHRVDDIPSILELLHWHFGKSIGHKSFDAPYQDADLAAKLSSNIGESINVCFMPIEHSLLLQKQANCDFLAEARRQYGIGRYNLPGHEIMTLASLNEIDQLYTVTDLHFRPQAARIAIGTLVQRAVVAMRQARPNAVPVLLVANWNARLTDMHREMIAIRALANCTTMLELADVALRYANSPWPMRYFFQPDRDVPAPTTLFQTPGIHSRRLGGKVWARVVGQAFAPSTPS